MKKVLDYLRKPTGIAPLVVFRIAFGVMMLASFIRFWLKGWIKELYIDPEFHFTYFGFSWVEPLPGDGMYFVFAGLIVLSIFIILGLAYRFSTTAFFLLFTYVELLDKAYYLNHYYFVSLLSFLLIFLPLHRNFSVDALLRPGLRRTRVPMWTLTIIRSQLALVYFFAGLAKLNADWLFRARPLEIWLRGKTDMPYIGWLFAFEGSPFLMSWFGAIYDLTIPFWLSWRRSRPFAYMTVIVFHVLTALLFNIGMFPWIMIVSTLIFFSEDDYQRLFNFLRKLLPKLVQRLQGIFKPPTNAPVPGLNYRYSLLTFFFGVFFLAQMLLPFRHYLYPGDTNWTQEGFRFSWRVMLVESRGQAIFFVHDPDSGQEWVVYPEDHLTTFQEEQMSFQPDMILEFAHYIEEIYRERGYEDVEVYAETYVRFNGRSSQLLLDPTVDLTRHKNNIWPKEWIRVAYADD